MEVVVRKALNISMSMSVIRNHADLELLFSIWNTKTYTFVTSWGEFTPSLEEVSVMFHLPK